MTEIYCGYRPFRIAVWGPSSQCLEYFVNKFCEYNRDRIKWPPIHRNRIDFIDGTILHLLTPSTELNAAGMEYDQFLLFGDERRIHPLRPSLYILSRLRTDVPREFQIMLYNINTGDIVYIDRGEEHHED